MFVVSVNIVGIEYYLINKVVAVHNVRSVELESVWLLVLPLFPGILDIVFHNVDSYIGYVELLVVYQMHPVESATWSIEHSLDVVFTKDISQTLPDVDCCGLCASRTTP